MLSYIVLRVVVLLYFLVVAGTIVVVILEKRQPVKTMAWVLVLIALPVVGIILFRAGRAQGAYAPTARNRPA